MKEIHEVTLNLSQNEPRTIIAERKKRKKGTLFSAKNSLGYIGLTIRNVVRSPNWK